MLTTSNTTHQSVFIFGPQGSSKTLHAPAIAKHFGLKTVLDEDFPQKIEEEMRTDHLITCIEPPARCRHAMHINEALQRLRQTPAGYPY